MDDQITTNLIAALFGEDPGRVISQDVLLKDVPKLINRALNKARAEARAPLESANEGWRQKFNEAEAKLADVSKVLHLAEIKAEDRAGAARADARTFREAMDKLR